MLLELKPVWKRIWRPSRWRRQIKSPDSSLGRVLRPVLRGLRRSRGFLTLGRSVLGRENLVAFYDLGHWPITYDFLWFTLAADIERRRRALKGLHFVFVPGGSWEDGPESKEYYRVIDGPARYERLFDILLPASSLTPSTRGVTVAASRNEASLLLDRVRQRSFPDSYVPELPNLPGGWIFPRLVMDAARSSRGVPSLKAPEGARQWLSRWRASNCADRPYVTITLRYFDYTPARNSNLDAWSEFARELEGRGFCVVVVPDTHSTLDVQDERLKGIRTFTEAAWNLHLRMALYEDAYLNLSVNTGPMVLCWLSPKCRYLIFKHGIEEAEAGPGSVAAQVERGLDPSCPIPIATPFQRRILEPDDLPIIRREFEAMHRLIEAEGNNRAEIKSE